MRVSHAKSHSGRHLRLNLAPCVLKSIPHEPPAASSQDARQLPGFRARHRRDDSFYFSIACRRSRRSTRCCSTEFARLPGPASRRCAQPAVRWAERRPDLLRSERIRARLDALRAANFLCRIRGEALCRIYLPYAVAIGVALLLMSLLSNRRIGGTSFWFNLSWSQPVSARLIAHQAFMTGQLDIVDNPIWSLVHELRVSLIFPLLLLLVGRIRASILLPALLTLPVIAPAPIHAMRQHWGCRRRWKRRVICSFLPPAPFWPLIEPLYRLTSSRRAGR
jgi:hypothetical protein